MDYNKIFKQSFSCIVPPTDDGSFIRSVTERKIAMEEKKKTAIRKPFIAVFAVIAALSLGVTGAAAAGIIDFNRIFGSTILAQNEEMGESLIGNAQGVEYSISDDDYAIELKGVTGNAETVIMTVEISRKDGTPVQEHFNNAERLEEQRIHTECTLLRPENREFAYGNSAVVAVNDQGNIEISTEVTLYNTHTGEPTNTAGEKIVFEGQGFYPAADIFSSSYFNTVFDTEADRAARREEFREELDRIALLALDWSVEFVYQPSEASLRTLGFVEKAPTAAFLNWSGDEEYEFTLSDIKVGCIDVKLTAEVQGHRDDACVISPHKNKVKLIGKDGAELDVMMLMTGGTSISYDEQRDVRTMYYEYSFYHGESRIAVNIDDIAAISINGTEYQLG